ncbi:MAG: phosphoribosyltransferase family protein [archaeon]
MISVSWDEFFELSQKLAKKVQKKRFDSVVCINRGGLVVGRMLSDALGLPLGVVSAKAYDVGRAEQRKDVVVDRKISIVGDTGKTVLLVDDIADNGATFFAVKSFLEHDLGLTVNTATLFRKKGCLFDVDFFVSDGVGDWIVMPYEANEFKGSGK